MQSKNIPALSDIDCAYQVLLEAITEGVLILTDEGIISYCNNSFAKILALSTIQVQGQAISKFLEDQDNERFQRFLLQPLHDAQIEITLRSCDSRTIPTLFTVVGQKCGSPLSAYVIVKELSDMLNSDVILEDRTKQLADAIKVLEIFSKMVFHDMRAPLRHIKNFTELLSEHLQVTMDDQSKQYMDIISSATTEIFMIISNLLYYYKKISI